MAKMFFFSVLPMVDPSESRYASMSSEMAESGDYITPKVRLDKCQMSVIKSSGLNPPVYKNKRGEFMAFWGKPPLHFWLSSTMVEVFGANGFGFRMASHLGGLFLLLVMFVILKSTYSPKVAMIATSGVACSGTIYMLSSLQMIDMTLMVFSVGSFFVNFAMLQTPDEAKRKKFLLKALTVILLAFGFLTKGPIALAMLAIPLLLWIAFTGQWKLILTYLWWPGALLFVAICLPWFVLAELKTPGFIYYFFVNENFLRFVSKDYGDFYGHGRVQFYGAAIVFLLISVLPLGFVILSQWFKSDRNPITLVKDLKKKPMESYFFIGFVSMTLFWCLTRKLLLTYLIPLVPAFFTWGAIRYKDQLNLKWYFRSILFFMLLYPVLIILVSPIVEKRNSTRTLMVACDSFNPNHKLPIYFVRRTMDSAYLYGENIISHPREAVSVSFNEIEKLDDGLIIVNERYLEDLPAGYKRWNQLEKLNHWVIFRKANPQGKR
ncbi:MAG: phospholipid carrier-dependent glycosyltransferase [Lentisphaeria bacterium]|nr:phospholipid carrier-dependent glycosyltransferase [Lentisphaeria bacterium]